MPYFQLFRPRYLEILKLVSNTSVMSPHHVPEAPRSSLDAFARCHNALDDGAENFLSPDSHSNTDLVTLPTASGITSPALRETRYRRK